MTNFNELLVVDSMTIYAWEYFTARKSGYMHGAKVIMHASPVCIDPFTGTPMMAGGKPVVNKALVINVPFYTTDEQAEILLALGKEKGQTVCDHENCKGFMINGDTIPPEYKYAFTNHEGTRVVSERYEFTTRMFKVRKDRDGRVINVVREGGKPIIVESILLVYWEGNLTKTMKQLSREEILRQELRNWQPVPADDKDDQGDNQDDQGNVKA